MSDPVNYDCESFKCNIDSNIINLNIPFSSDIGKCYRN